MGFDLKFSTFMQPVIAGGKAKVILSLNYVSAGQKSASEAVDVHAGFQGGYPWGDSPYVEGVQEVSLKATSTPQGGVVCVPVTLEIPYKILIELECEHFSYFAYVASKGGKFTTETPVVTSGPIEVEAPKAVTREELGALLSQVKWLVENSALSSRVKESFTANLETQIEAVSELDGATNLKTLKGRLEAFRKELESGRARRYRAVKLWARQIYFIISRLQKLKATRILQKVPTEKAFRLYTEVGQYTGVTTESLGDFLNRLATIEVKALEFHFPRKDFENWITDVLGDEELAEELGKVRESNLSGESLRSAVLSILNERYLKHLRLSQET